MTYCTRCCLPDTVEGIKFDDAGVCLACQSYDQKSEIDWASREKTLANLLNYYKTLPGDYDCIVPISGGKDSTYQLHIICKVYGMRALAVTFSHNWFSEVGKLNLENALEKFNVDHIMFTPNRSLVNRLARQSLFEIGDACWTCHAGVGAFPLQVAVKWKIPLLIWGESIAESSGRATHKEPGQKFDRDYFTKQSAKLTDQDMACEEIPLRELSPFRLPDYKELEGVRGIHLGDYINWDTEAQVEFIKEEYGWLEDDVEGTYKRYKSVECKMAGVHDYLCYLKRGYGRATIHASEDVRAGRLTREQGFELARQYDPVEPNALREYKRITGFNDCDIGVIMGEHKDKVRNG
jgi:N-acetyl sugar amidotransferase